MRDVEVSLNAAQLVALRVRRIENIYRHINIRRCMYVIQNHTNVTDHPQSLFSMYKICQFLYLQR